MDRNPLGHDLLKQKRIAKTKKIYLGRTLVDKSKDKNLSLSYISVKVLTSSLRFRGVASKSQTHNPALCPKMVTSTLSYYLSYF